MNYHTYWTNHRLKDDGTKQEFIEMLVDSFLRYGILDIYQVVLIQALFNDTRIQALIPETVLFGRVEDVGQSEGPWDNHGIDYVFWDASREEGEMSWQDGFMCLANAIKHPLSFYGFNAAETELLVRTIQTVIPEFTEPTEFPPLETIDVPKNIKAAAFIETYSSESDLISELPFEL